MIDSIEVESYFNMNDLLCKVLVLEYDIIEGRNLVPEPRCVLCNHIVEDEE